ncbi:guanitoxin biosynthesis heme-dependent pre-guanitoxin N-hydroxylase GntA [Kordia jejudonensis]|uniref:guanitoxin biosynthesis heme-dependent pre-guanitoxin N-hydroxylase GntA n=1 Tax=Kordia jejudonensis TaxID=1348245 RepID=UPI000A6B0DE6|nr:guanitoxin biosynthesis heme-dependent pre-guanitoxin N-hydroxylase GntA [Kordia jejudonensis]
MAKTLFKLNNYHLKVYRDINDDASIQNLLKHLEEYLKQYDFDSNEFQTFIAVFPNNHYKNEFDFETSLWQLLQKLHEFDDCTWDASVSDNPKNENFSFSIKGNAYYIIGLHPRSSRIARRSPYTSVVFNLHWQFEKLREMGIYKNVKNRIRKNDKNLQGSINPVLKDFGDESEAKQYSGRNTEKNWKCPFQKKSK